MRRLVLRDNGVLMYERYLKDCSQPAIRLMSLGERSLAGLRAYPQLAPKQIPIPRIVNPTYKGTRADGT